MFLLNQAAASELTQDIGNTYVVKHNMLFWEVVLLFPIAYIVVFVGKMIST